MVKKHAQWIKDQVAGETENVGAGGRQGCDQEGGVCRAY